MDLLEFFEEIINRINPQNANIIYWDLQRQQ